MTFSVPYLEIIVFLECDATLGRFMSSILLATQHSKCRHDTSITTYSGVVSHFLPQTLSLAGLLAKYVEARSSLGILICRTFKQIKARARDRAKLHMVE